MNSPHLALLHAVPGQAREAGEFASAALQRNIAVGVIILLVVAVAWLAWSLRAAGNERVKAAEQHAVAIDALHKDYATKLQNKDDAHAAFDKDKSERIAAEMKDKDQRGYDQTVKVTEVVVQIGHEMANLTTVIKDVLAKL